MLISYWNKELFTIPNSDSLCQHLLNVRLLSIQDLPTYVKATRGQFSVQYCHIAFRYFTGSTNYACVWGRRVIGISGSLIWLKTLTELIFSPCGEFWWSLEGSVSQIHSPHLHIGAPGIFSDLSRSVQMLKGEWGCRKQRKATAPIYP